MQEIEQQNKFLVTLQQEKNKTEIEIQGNYFVVRLKTEV